LRLEEDRTGHGADAAKAGESTLRNIKTQILTHFNDSTKVPVYYACGPLAPALKKLIPSNWRHKNDYFDPANWAAMWRGRWFDGREYDVTNATGSLVDMFVLLEAPLTILADFSSFGEYVAALRCGAGRLTMLYDSEGAFSKVDCSLQVMFQRWWHSENRKLNCVANRELPGCLQHRNAHNNFKRHVLRLDNAMRDYRKELVERRPR